MYLITANGDDDYTNDLNYEDSDDDNYAKMRFQLI